MFWFIYFITSIIFTTTDSVCSSRFTVWYTGLSKKWITLSLNSAKMTGLPSSKEIFFLAELNTLAFIFGDKCDTRCNKICAFFWGLFWRALVALAAALPSTCLLEKELLIANGDEWLGDDIAEVELAVTDFFCFLFLSLSFALQSSYFVVFFKVSLLILFVSILF